MSNIGKEVFLAAESDVDLREHAEIVSERDSNIAGDEYTIYSLRWPTGVVTDHRDSDVVLVDDGDQDSEDDAKDADEETET